MTHAQFDFSMMTQNFCQLPVSRAAAAVVTWNNILIVVVNRQIESFDENGSARRGYGFLDIFWK